MHLTYSRARLDALMGGRLPEGADEIDIARHVIDGMIKNEDLNRCGFTDWTAGLAVTTYADEHFIAREELDADEIDWVSVYAAVDEALRMLKLPEGITLIESNSWDVWACGRDLDGAKADFGRQLGPHAFEETTSRSQDRFLVIRGPMPEGGWEASDGDRVLMMGTLEGHLLAHAIAREAA